MYNNFFSFNGRVGRSRFIILTFALAFSVVIGIYILKVINLFISGMIPIGITYFIAHGLIAVLFLAATWCSLSLIVRRVRDMGMPPIIVVPLIASLQIFDAFLLTKLIDVRFIPPYSDNTPLGGAVNLITTFALLFWPSASPVGSHNQGDLIDPSRDTDV